MDNQALEQKLKEVINQRDAWGLTHQKDVKEIERLMEALEKIVNICTTAHVPSSKAMTLQLYEKLGEIMCKAEQALKQ